MKTIHYTNKIRSLLVTIAPMAPFTPKSTSKSYISFPAMIRLNPDNKGLNYRKPQFS